MKYFTRAWHNGELDDKLSDKIYEDYCENLKKLSQAMPSDIKQLAMGINLHDAIIENVVVFTQEHSIALTLVVGDLSIGYQTVKIVYENVTMDKSSLDIIEKRSRDRCTCILSQEIDYGANGQYIHRLIFWPEDEVEISFLNLKLIIESCENRRVELGGYFVEKDS